MLFGVYSCMHSCNFNHICGICHYGKQKKITFMTLLILNNPFGYLGTLLDSQHQSSNFFLP